MKQGERSIKRRGLMVLFLLSPFSLLLSSFALAPYAVSAATATAPAVDLNQAPSSATSPFGAFKLVQCDGPDLSGLKTPITVTVNGKSEQTTAGSNPDNYVPCNFAGLMMQIQFLLNVMLVVGVLAAIVGFAYAGYLYVTGTQENLKKARSMFPKILIGFILILTAWFIVYQILAWLTPNAASYLGTGS
jgi:hypothetical protein